VIAQPFLVGALSVVRNRPFPQNDLELCRQGRRDVTHRGLSSSRDNPSVSMIPLGKQSDPRKHLSGIRA